MKGVLEMCRKLIIHDLEESIGNSIVEEGNEDIAVFRGDLDINHCVGCFGCWVKTPGKCLINDRAQRLPSMIASCDEIVLISENLYGGFSSKVKRCLDRSIGYILPFFRIVNDEMHHSLRHYNAPTIKAHFYGNNISEEEKELAINLVEANGINLGASSTEVYFYNNIESMKGDII